MVAKDPDYQRKWRAANPDYGRLWYKSSLDKMLKTITIKKRRDMKIKEKEEEQKSAHRKVILDTEYGEQGEVL